MTRPHSIPVRTPLGREVRKAFVPRGDDFVLLAADYSQIELRVMAEISGDEGMRQAFKDGLDIHAMTASEMFDVPMEEMTPEIGFVTSIAIGSVVDFDWACPKNTRPSKLVRVPRNLRTALMSP